MAVYTEVTDDALEGFVAEYDIGRVLSCKGIAEGVENSNYLLQTEKGKYILTLYEKRVNPEDLPYLFDSKELQVTKWGTLKTNFDTMETNLEGVFAAGDIVRGASLVVWAIKDGRDAAIAMKNYLESKELKKIKVA